MPYTIHYRFSQRFNVSAQDAYDWCTDYQPDDHTLIGYPDAKRVVTWLTDCTVLLKEIFPTSIGTVEKEKLVQLYPDRLMWVSTHVAGPNKYSQYLYQIVPEEKSTSRLDFHALHIEHRENSTEKELAALTDELYDGDSMMWKRFTKAMEKELLK